MLRSTDEFINLSKNIHKDSNNVSLYDYSEVIYKGYKYPVTIICKKCGNKFEQKPRYHLKR